MVLSSLMALSFGFTLSAPALMLRFPNFLRLCRFGSLSSDGSFAFGSLNIDG
jgi:hypothetical protein